MNPGKKCRTKRNERRKKSNKQENRREKTFTSLCITTEIIIYLNRMNSCIYTHTLHSAREHDTIQHCVQYEKRVEEHRQQQYGNERKKRLIHPLRRERRFRSNTYTDLVRTKSMELRKGRKGMTDRTWFAPL